MLKLICLCNKYCISAFTGFRTLPNTSWMSILIENVEDGEPMKALFSQTDDQNKQ